MRLLLAYMYTHI